MKATKLVIGASLLTALVAVSGTAAADDGYSLVECVRDSVLPFPDGQCGKEGNQDGSDIVQEAEECALATHPTDTEPECTGI